MPWMNCIITGADLVDHLNDRFCHGDLFEIEDCYVFNAVTGDGGQTLWEPGHQTPRRYVLALDYWERRGVFIVPKGQAMLSESAKQYVSKWGPL